MRFSGCDGYAAALSEGKTKETNLCAPGGADAAKGVAAVLGVEAGDIKPMAAFVHCNGTHETVNSSLTMRGREAAKWQISSSEDPRTAYTAA